MKIFLVILIILVNFLSCATTEKYNASPIKTIPIPDVTTNFNISFHKDNIEILGPIDLKINFLIRAHPSIYDTQYEEPIYDIAYFGNENPLRLVPGMMDAKEIAYRSLLSMCLKKYPEMDYILFPKISVSKNTPDLVKGDSGVDVYEMRIVGKAARIKF